MIQARPHSRKRGALHSLEPGRVRVRELEGHDAGVPALRDGLLNTRPKGRRIDKPAVRDVAQGTGLADDELLEVDARFGGFEDRGPARVVKQRVAGLVAGRGRLCKRGSVQKHLIEVRKRHPRL